MSKTKFTSGEWYTDGYFSNDGQKLEIRATGDVLICDRITSEHDAALIAAAPKLYAMLQSLSKGEGLLPGETVEGLLAEARGE